MRRRDAVPRGPWVLSIGGLLPFMATLVGSVFAPAPLDGVSTTIFYAYGAAILSFLGGTRWGFEIGARPDQPGWLTLVVAIVPSLLAASVAITQYVAPMLGLGLLSAGFFMMLVWDLASTGGGVRRWPNWYRPLRITMTLSVLVMLGIMGWIQTH
jgi:Protein of unknown function (DUF3429)